MLVGLLFMSYTWMCNKHISAELAHKWATLVLLNLHSGHIYIPKYFVYINCLWVPPCIPISSSRGRTLQ